MKGATSSDASASLDACGFLLAVLLSCMISNLYPPVLAMCLVHLLTELSVQVELSTSSVNKEAPVEDLLAFFLQAFF
jgi:hypothetical protein